MAAWSDSGVRVCRGRRPARRRSPQDTYPSNVPQAQRERVQALTKEAIANAKPLAEQAKVTRTALMTEWKSATPDAAKVHQLVDSQLESVRSFAHTLTDKALEVHQLLTPKQRDVLTEKAERFEKRAKH